MNNSTSHKILGRLLLAGVCMAGSAFYTLIPVDAAAQATTTKKAASHGELLSLLGAYHELPSKDLFDAVGTDVVKQLHQIVQNDDILRAKRYRALEALATYWPGADTTALFAAQFAAPEHELMLHQLMALSSKHLPAAKATALIAPYLTHKDEQLRYTAVDALGRIDTKESRELLNKALVSESNDWVKAHIEQMLIQVK